MFALVAILILTSFLLIVYWKSLGQKASKRPPGPKGWPIFGSIFQISPTHAHRDFQKLSVKYGDIFAVNMAGKKVVVLNSAAVIREAFFSPATKDIYAGRPTDFYAKYSDRGPSLLYTPFSKEWMLQRKVFVKSLKMYGEEGEALENTILQQIQVVVGQIRECAGKPVDLSTFIRPALTNIILIIMSGKSFQYDDIEFLAAVEFDTYNVRMLTGQINSILSAFPFLRHLPVGYGKLYKKHRQSYDRLIHYFHTTAKADFDPQKSRGVVADLLRLQPTTPWMTDEKIHGMLRDCIGAGLGTTRGSLMAFFLVILHKPEVMYRIQAEISSVIGKNRAPTVKDRQKMPYTEAALMELLRYLSNVPLAAPHSTMKDVTLRGYHIPANTTVIANLWTAHHDDRVWEEPWEFKPERFLDSDGQVVPPEHKNRFNWLAFSTGRRACSGQYFGRSRVFLFITALLQQFNFRPCAEHKLPSCDPRGFSPGITLHPPTYFVVAEEV